MHTNVTLGFLMCTRLQNSFRFYSQGLIKQKSLKTIYQYKKNKQNKEEKKQTKQEQQEGKQEWIIQSKHKKQESHEN